MILKEQESWSVIYISKLSHASIKFEDRLTI